MGHHQSGRNRKAMGGFGLAVLSSRGDVLNVCIFGGHMRRTSESQRLAIRFLPALETGLIIVELVGFCGLVICSLTIWIIAISATLSVNEASPDTDFAHLLR